MMYGHLVYFGSLVPSPSLIIDYWYVNMEMASSPGSGCSMGMKYEQLVEYSLNNN